MSQRIEYLLTKVIARVRAVFELSQLAKDPEAEVRIQKALERCLDALDEITVSLPVARPRNYPEEWNWKPLKNSHSDTGTLE